MNMKKLLICLLSFTILFSGCGDESSNDDKDLLLTVGDSKVNLDEGKFFAYSKQANYEAYYLASGYEITWDAPYSAQDENGNKTKNLEELVKNETLKLIKKTVILSEYAKSEGITLTDEDKKAIENSVKTFLSDSDDTLIKKIGASEDVLNSIYTRQKYLEKISDKIIADAKITVTDEEAFQVNITALELNDSNVKNPEESAKEIYDKVQNGEKLEDVAKEYKLTASVGNVGRGDMNGDDLEKKCFELKTGESALVEIDGYYFVVYCNSDFDKEATETAKELLTEEKGQEAVDKFYEELEKDTEIKLNEELWDSIVFDEHIFTIEDMQETEE